MELKNHGSKSGMAAGFCKVCDSGFWPSGRRVVGQKQKKVGPCQSIKGKWVDITRLQVPPRPPKRQSKGCLFFCQSILAKTAKTPWVPITLVPKGSFASIYAYLHLFAIVPIHFRRPRRPHGDNRLNKS